MSYDLNDTIYALASGQGRAGVAVIRVSGKMVLPIIRHMTDIQNPKPRYAHFTAIKEDDILLDKGLVLYFKAPASWTGEDTAEFHIHGGRAVIEAVLHALSRFPDTRPADHGEFSRRAVLNGKMDLTQAEGLMDLIDADTALQRTQAFSQLQGNLKDLYDTWRALLKHHMAYLEAFIDFPEEEIPPENLQKINADIQDLAQRIAQHLDDNQGGEKVRRGFHILLLGKPNAGKSSLLNKLVQKEVAIVSQTAGTTRDIIETYLEIDGFPVIFSDTAGLRESAEEIEAEGIRRALTKAQDADLILHLSETKSPHPPLPAKLSKIPTIRVFTKADLYPTTKTKALSVSVKTGKGIPALWQQIRDFLHTSVSKCTGHAITRERYRIALTQAQTCLTNALSETELELKAEQLRLANRALGRITGTIQTEELLDVIFKDFCIGK